MPPLTTRPTIAVTSLLAGGMLAVLTPLATPPASADPGAGPHGEAFQHGRKAGVKLTNSKITLSGSGLRGKSDGYKMPNPCWYEPSMSAQEARDLKVREKKESVETGGDYRPDLGEFSSKLDEKGSWWGVGYNAGDPKGEACASGRDPLVWVPEGDTPAGGITFEQLAQLARAALTVPQPTIKLSPDAKSYVNLETWVWLDQANQAPRSVTATLPGVMSATVTATPDKKGMTIEPGTSPDRAEVITTGCGQTGHPYVKGGDFTCGVRYKRASIDQPRKVYTLTVTTTWNVVGNGQNLGGGAVDPFIYAPLNYAPVQVNAQRDVPVGEVQSVVQK
ncbi:hypothetical protein [Microbispora triticiradicis]|uniref:hypothetical protein n=1 Tax=Microbispora TaxID=2005 RepID=UPI0037CC9627